MMCDSSIGDVFQTKSMSVNRPEGFPEPGRCAGAVNFVDGNQKIQADYDRALLPRLRDEKIAVGRWPAAPALNCAQK
jgi:hypothetical protein